MISLNKLFDLKIFVLAIFLCFSLSVVADCGDIDLGAELFDDMAKAPDLADAIKFDRDLADSWRRIAERPSWVRQNEDLLFDLVNKSDAFLERVNFFYKKLALPENLPRPLPSSINHTFNGKTIVVKYNKYGLPEFGEHMTKITVDGVNVSRTFKGGWSPISTSRDAASKNDLQNATSWALDTDSAGNLINFPEGRVRAYTKPNGELSKEKIEILDDDGNWIVQTWHHHENGRDLVPVPSAIHNHLNHSGGFTAKHGPKGAEITADTDITGLFDYDPI